jgi:hypothetical protein
MMPIKGWTDGARLPRLGSIDLGYFDEAKNAPTAVDYFVVPPEVQAVYGEKPKELDILIPHESLEVVMPAYLKRYGEKFGLICRGDGETASINVNYGHLNEYGVEKVGAQYIKKGTSEVLPVVTARGKQYIQTACPYKNCWAYGKKKCREVAILSVILYKVPGVLGVYSIDTGSFNSYQNIKNALEILRGMLGRITYIPLKLKVTMQEKNPTIERDGKTLQIKRAVPIMYIDMGKYTMENVLQMAHERKLLAVAHLPSASPVLMEEPNEENKPELLYPPIEDESVSVASENITEDHEAEPSLSSKSEKSVPYQGMVTIVSKPKENGKILSATCKDESGDLILLCSNTEGPLKNSFLAFQPGESVQVTGQLKENGHRYVMSEGLEIIPF